MNRKVKILIKVTGLVAAVIAIMIVGYYAGVNFKAGSSMGVSGNEAEKLEKYIDLGAYKGIEVDKLIIRLSDITDEMAESEMEYILEDYKEYKDVTDRAVKKGDLVNFDFEGEIDGEKPEDMAGEEFELVIGEGEFIEDLEEGLIGVAIGKETKIDVIFPEDYDAEYAGKKATFTVNVNSIQELVTEPELTDEFLSEHTEYKSVEDMKNSVKKELMQTEIDTNKEQMYADIMLKAVENSKLKEYPQERFDEVYAELRAEMEQGAAMFGITFEEYLEFSGVSGDIPDEWVEERILETGVSRLIMYQEKIKLSEKEYNEMINENLEQFGVETVEEVTNEYNKQELTDYCLSLKLEEFLIKEAKITELSYADYNQKYNDVDAE